MNLCQCPLGLIPHFYADSTFLIAAETVGVNALSGLYLISTVKEVIKKYPNAFVSMPSRAYTSFLRLGVFDDDKKPGWCQCPLGLIPHFYKAARNKLSVAIEMCQCPLGLIPHFYWRHDRGAVMLRVVSMPSRAYTSFLQGARYGKED